MIANDDGRKQGRETFLRRAGWLTLGVEEAKGAGGRAPVGNIYARAAFCKFAQVEVSLAG
jgi:hypothetical protein